MTKAAFGALLAASLGLGLAFRVIGLDARPMHHDEANQAVKFGALLEHGEYRYDRTDHHGPTLYYLTLPAAWARGQTTLASLDERTLRFVPALFGAGLILLFGLLAGGLGRTAVAASACLAAVSPALTYYSRFYIQESLLVFFAVAFLIAFGRFVSHPRMGAAAGSGVFAGLAFATKETAVIVLAAAIGAAALAHRLSRDTVPRPRPVVSRARVVAMLVVGLAAAGLVALVFYSSWFRYPSGLIESVRAFGTYAERGVGTGPHTQPWDYYLRLLWYSASGGVAWTEGFVLVLALVGLGGAFGARADFWSRYVALYALVATAAFSAIPYKTPWNLLPFYAGILILAGIGADVVVTSWRPRFIRVVVALALVAGTWHLGAESWRANGRYSADPRNPYVYAHTTPDFVRLVQRVTAVSSVHADGPAMLVKVVAGPYEQWPLPWYLRQMTRVGYWTHASEAGALDAAPVVIASQDEAAAVDAALGDRYVSEFYSLRPDVLLTLYVERGLWERFLATRTRPQGG